MKVLSLFDGMSCGRIALDKMGVTVDQYYAAEIDKHAVKFVGSKWKDTIQLGDVCAVHAKDLPPIDLLIGGSPCQGFSLVGKQLNFNDPRSILFFEFVRLLKDCKEINPNMYFMLENVKMKKEYQDIISNVLGVQPIKINSALMSCQNRERLYWTNINEMPNDLFDGAKASIQMPTDKGIFLRHILQKSVDEKYYFSEKMMNYLTTRKGNFNGGKINYKYDNVDQKAACFNASSKSVDISDNIIVETETGRVRKLTPIEVCRLQTVPDDYFFDADGKQIVSDTQIYKMCGNGWTVDVIAHILSFAKFN